jgi:putative phage-type endonuclease
MTETTLPPAELLPPGAGPHDQRWHELRRQGVTASEIAAVMGISPYESPFSLYWRKVNGWQFEGNEYTRAGQHLEASIADWWLFENGAQADLTTMHAGLYANPERPWQLATPDRIVIDIWGKDVALLECKWVAHSWDGWGEQGTDQVPVHYRAQCLWQADVMGVDEVHVAALGPGGFRSYVVGRDDWDLKLMRDAGAEFYRRLVEQDPPPLDSHTATLGALKQLYPSVGEGDVQIPGTLAVGYTAARMKRKEAEESIARCEAEIRDLLGSTYARAVWDGRTVASRSVFDVERLDVKRLRAELPEVAAQYLTKTTTDKLTPGRAKS